jgi:hypothetical protein
MTWKHDSVAGAAATLLGLAAKASATCRSGEVKMSVS